MTFCGSYELTPEERQRISVVVTVPDRKRSLEWLAERYGGTWADTGDGVVSAQGPKRTIGPIKFFITKLYYLRIFECIAESSRDDEDPPALGGSASE